MDWTDLYTADKQPTETEIAEYINSPLWSGINEFLSQNYDVKPVYSYSKCSGQPGWNIKYQKAGRSLCTLYPMPGFFIALVVIGTKEQQDAEVVLPGCSDYTQNLFAKTPFCAGGRWLMLQVTEESLLEDTKRLIQVRRKIKKTG